MVGSILLGLFLLLILVFGLLTGSIQELLKGVGQEIRNLTDRFGGPGGGRAA